METAPLTSAHVQARTASHQVHRSGSTSHARLAAKEAASLAERHLGAASNFRSAAGQADDGEALRMLKLLEDHHEQLARLLRSRHTSTPRDGQHLLDQSQGQGQAQIQGHGQGQGVEVGAPAQQQDGTGRGSVPAAGAGEGMPEVKEAAAASAASANNTASEQQQQQLTLEQQHQQQQQQAGPRVTQRQPRREVSSSIANNLASARGIRAGTASKSGPAAASPASPGIHRSPSSTQGLDVLPSSSEATRSTSRQDGHVGVGSEDGVQGAGSTVEHSHKAGPGAGVGPGSNSDSDAAFQRFYSTFEGLFSKLSAPLAFAGLPLLLPGEDSNTTAGRGPLAEPGPGQASGGPLVPATHSQDQKGPSRMRAPVPTAAAAAASAASPDVNKLFSKAAVRAVSSDHPGLSGPVHESFFVVPTAGGTLPYATVARQHSLKRDFRGSAADEGAPRVGEGGTADEDGADGQQFVDAQETRVDDAGTRAGSASRVAGRSSAQPAARPGSGSTVNKTPEELQLENESLRQLTDTLSRRLYMWEKSSQTQSLALQQSLVQQRPEVKPEVKPEGLAEGKAEGQARGQGEGKLGVQGSRSTSGAAHEEREAGKGGGGGGGGGGTGSAGEGGEGAEQGAREELERRVSALSGELDRQTRENEKLRTVVLRYRERWEKLKEGARGRRGSTAAAGAGGHAGSGGGGGSGGL